MTAIRYFELHLCWAFTKHRRRDCFVCPVHGPTAVGPEWVRSGPVALSLYINTYIYIQCLGLVLCNAMSGMPPVNMIHNKKVILQMSALNCPVFAAPQPKNGMMTMAWTEESRRGHRLPKCVLRSSG